MIVGAQEFAAGRRRMPTQLSFAATFRPFQRKNAMKNHGVSAQPGATQRTTSAQQEADGRTESHARLPQGQMPDVGSRDIGVNNPGLVGAIFFNVVFCYSSYSTN